MNRKKILGTVTIALAAGLIGVLGYMLFKEKPTVNENAPLKIGDKIVVYGTTTLSNEPQFTDMYEKYVKPGALNKDEKKRLGYDENIEIMAEVVDGGVDGLGPVLRIKLPEGYIVPAPQRITPTTDSDSDGLTDIDELKKIGTSPKKQDTDGDGYEDGDEVKNGYNPCGEGKLPIRDDLIKICADLKK